MLDREVTRGFQKRLYDLIDYLLPLYRDEGKSQLVMPWAVPAAVTVR